MGFFDSANQWIGKNVASPYFKTVYGTDWGAMRPGETGEQYMARVTQGGLLNGFMTATGMRPEPQQGQSSMDGKNAQVDQQFQAFLDEIKALQDPNSAYSQQVMKNAGAAAGRQANAQGVQGGLAGANSEQAMTNAIFNNKMQLMGLQGQGLQGLDSRNRWANDFGYQQMMNQWQANRANQAGIFGLLGGAAGATIGGMAGGPAGIAAGWQAGSNIGAGAGTMAYGAPPSYGGYGGGGNRGGNW